MARAKKKESVKTGAKNREMKKNVMNFYFCGHKTIHSDLELMQLLS